MTVKEFWEEDPNLLWAYRKSYIEKMKLEKEKTNFSAWLQGMYVYEAVSKALYNGFRKSGQASLDYSNSPYEFNEVKSVDEKRKEEIIKSEEQIRKRNREISELLKEQKGNG